MLATIGSSEAKSSQGLVQPMYVLTADDGNRAVSAGVIGGMIGSGRAEVSSVVASSLLALSVAKCSDTSLNILDLKWLLVIGAVTKETYRCISFIVAASLAKLPTPLFNK